MHPPPRPNSRVPTWLVVCLLAPVLHLNASVLWQIGRFDESSSEFHQWIHPTTGERQIDYSVPGAEPVFVVGTSDAARDWQAYQPGSANGGTGFREHPWTILFRLDAPPRRPLQLRVALLSYSARLPALRLDLNGRQGVYFQEPRLVGSAGDTAVFFQPHYATSIITAVLDTEWFLAGTNRLVLSAIDETKEREDVRPSGFPWLGNSGLVYDALTLEELSSGELPPARVRIMPSPFYRQREGQLLEEVDVVVTPESHRRPVRVEFSMGPFSAAHEWPGDPSMGEARFRFDVPEWSGAKGSTVRLVFADTQWSTNLTIEAARRWQVWIVPHEHLDVGYTDDPAKVAELQSRVVDDVLLLGQRHPGFRFTIDGAWVLEEYLAGRDPRSRDHALAAIRQGTLGLPVVHGSLFTGSASLEGLIRNLYPSRALAQAHGLPFDTAIITDVPSYSWSWASVLAAAGVRYFVGASDAYRGPFLLRNNLHRQSPHAWEGPDGGRVITWYSRHYHQFSSLFGLPPSTNLARESLPRFLQAYDHPAYRASDVLLYGTQVENVALQPEQAGFADVWNRHYAYPRLRYGTFTEALDAITRQQGELEVVRGDGGPYWEDGLAANARITALARSNSRRLLTAEKIASVAASSNSRWYPDLADLRAAWRHSLLIDEHTWHADCSVRDPDSLQARRQGEAKDAHAVEARRALERVVHRGLSALSDVLPIPPASLVLFNPSSWARQDVVEAEIGRGQGLVDPENGSLVPLEILRSGKVYQRVRFASPPVPALGVRALRLRPLPSIPRTRPPSHPLVLESPHFRVTLDPARGGLASLWDKRLGRELAQTNRGHAFGQWLYVTGGDTLPNRLVQFSTVSPIPDLEVHAAGGGLVSTSYVTEVGAVARVRSSTRNFESIELEVFLPHPRPEVRLTYRVRKTPTRSKEAAYVAFPFALDRPTFRYAIQNGWVDPARHLLPGACQEWFTVQDWVAVQAASGPTAILAPLDAPLVTLGDIVRGTWPETFGDRPATVFSYVMSNYTPEGYAAEQGGDFVFRYVVTASSAFDAGLSARWGAESLTPFEVNEVTRSDKLGVGGQPADHRATQPWLRMEPDRVHLTAWKPAEDGRGFILRLLETAGEPADVILDSPHLSVDSAYRCNAVEEDIGPLPIANGRTRISMPAFGIATLRWIPRPSAP
ncbi:MAG: hypothetical protein JNK85_03630 [Verrucomicrobiales bacterium]|nr:hypothetical protein [Verrucomicrobiales bacterium]